jgi:phenylpropionate dioxygenase-like ring-hydroxylating dioxygenase large terminal subunit
MTFSKYLLNDQKAITRIFEHMDNGSTDLGNEIWKEPVGNYYSLDRFNQEINLLRSMPIPFCPSAAISKTGSYVARKASGTPILAVRNEDGTVKAFINACKHRGMQVAEGMGFNKKAFVCPYHAWTYDFNGNLKRIPGQEGFPGIEIDKTNLYEVDAAEKGGIVYIKQNGKINKSELENALDFFTKDQELFDTGEVEDCTNWKLITETLLEGYHIKSLHKNTFYPYGLDNINLVESYGLNSRIIFPFKRIEKLRNIEPAKRNISGMVTKVYHLFPNVSVSVLSKHTSLTIIEPVSPTRAKLISYLLVNNQKGQKEITLEEAKKDAIFVNESGQAEDRAAAIAIQETVSTKANNHLTFGYFEKAIVNFHKNLSNMLKL